MDFKSVKPANTDRICAVKYTCDNVLIPNIEDGGDLSSIDPTQYKTLRLVWTLTRNSVEDESPELHEPFWSWLGGVEKEIYDTPTHTTTSSSYVTVLEKTTPGMLLAISNESPGTTTSRLKITIDETVIRDDLANSTFFSPSGGSKYIIYTKNFNILKVEHATSSSGQKSITYVSYKE